MYLLLLTYLYFIPIIYFKHKPRSSCPIPTSSLFSNSSEPMRNGSGRCRYGSCNKYHCKFNTRVHAAPTYYKVKTCHIHMSSNCSLLTGDCKHKHSVRVPLLTTRSVVTFPAIGHQPS